MLVSTPGLSAAFRIEKGVLDLRSWDPRHDPVIELKGEAEFHWQNFIVSDPKGSQEATYLEISRPWNQDSRYSPFGFASFRVKILMPGQGQEHIRLMLEPATTRSRVFVNGILQTDFGEPLPSLESPGHDQAHGHRPRLIPVPMQAPEIDLVYEISNWDLPQVGGFWGRHLKIGLTSELEQQMNRQLSLDAAFIAIFLVMGVYHLLIFALRREDKSNVHFTFMAFSMAAHLASGNMSASNELLASAWTFSQRFIIYSLGWIGSMVGLVYFVAHVFPVEMKMRLAHIFACLTIPFALLILFVKPALSLQILPVYQISVLIAVIYIVVAVARAVRNGRSGARLFLFITASSALVFVHDALQSVGVIDSKPLAMYYALAFILVQSALLSMRFAQAFRQVQILSDEIVEKEKARTVFFHNTSHELRTPLNGILGFLDLVRGGHYGPVPEKVRIQIDKAWRLAESLKLQVNTILDLAKSKRGELRLTIQGIDLVQLRKDCDVLAEGLQLKFPGTQYSSQLDDIAGTRRWHGDREKTLTIIRNLLGNAFKFRSPDRPNHVRLMIEHRQGELLIRVSDQGIGIAPEHQNHIFEEFSQAQSDARRSYEGTGLGLTMVRDLVKLGQGSIQVDSALDRGSLFLVKLPELSQSSENETHAIQDGPITVSEVKEESAVIQSLATENTAGIREFASQHRVLVVDDNTSNLEVMNDILSLDGYQIELADGGKKALQILEESLPDLVILDLMMPEVSGEDVLRAVRSTPRLRDLPVIILTARASDQDRIASLGLGADEYMSKPFDPRELGLRVYNTIERRELQRQALDSEHRQRLSELGELFTDLSHELKNVFQLPHQQPQRLAEIFPQLWNRPDLPSSVQVGLQKVLELSGRSAKRSALLEQLQKIARQKWPEENRRRAARIVAFGSLDEPEALELWNQLQELPASAFASLQDQLDLGEQFVDFQEALYRGRDLALSALDLERMGQGQGKSLLREVMGSLQTLLQARLRKTGVEFRCQVPALELPLAAGVLQQVMINLIGNAIDALQNQPTPERWVEVSYQDDHEFCQLRIRNGGPKIDSSMAKQIFHRGFSTKGKQGTGLGLSLSRRLIKEQGGELAIDLQDEHTAFVISFAKKKEERLA
jgi:signal transduction histidine kinase